MPAALNSGFQERCQSNMWLLYRAIYIGMGWPGILADPKVSITFNFFAKTLCFLKCIFLFFNIKLLDSERLKNKIMVCNAYGSSVGCAS